MCADREFLIEPGVVRNVIAVIRRSLVTRAPMSYRIPNGLDVTLSACFHERGHYKRSARMADDEAAFHFSKIGLRFP
jgi:hypothetical protein